MAIVRQQLFMFTKVSIKRNENAIAGMMNDKGAKELLHDRFGTISP
jgi:hypothetical protein